MVSHMKTTINISDSILLRSKEVATREGITLRELFEQALRRALEERERHDGFGLADASVGGDGLQLGQSWELPRELAYDDAP
jgi:cytidylate kinase